MRTHEGCKVRHYLKSHPTEHARKIPGLRISLKAQLYRLHLRQVVGLHGDYHATRKFMLKRKSVDSLI